MKVLHFAALSLLLLLLCQIIIADLDSDKKALLQFANAVPHGRTLNWKSSSSVCKSWIGVTCTANGKRVLTLRLPAFGLYGNIPANTLTKLGALSILSLRSNRLNGTLPSDILSIPSLRYIYLQENDFSGDIPSSFSPQLNSIDLSFNSFIGNIPSEIQSSTLLTSLNLQNNSLTGTIPDFNLPRLTNLSLSNNHLNGSIPSTLRKFPASSFQGNSMLCGAPLNRCADISPSRSPSPSPFPSPAPSPASIPITPPSRDLMPSTPSAFTPPIPTIPQTQTEKKALSRGGIIGISVGVSAAVCGLLVAIVLCCVKKKKKQTGVLQGKGLVVEKPRPGFGSGAQDNEKNRLTFFKNCSYNFDLEDLLRASAEVLGKGTYGTTYKAALEEGTMVVVKRLKEVVAGRREFEQQMEIVGNLEPHPNVVPPRAYYFSKDEKLIVHDYVTLGSLAAILHGHGDAGRMLDWESRVKILLGAAKGIAHLHASGNGRLTHGNIKSSNILLNRDFSGSISDYGVTPLMGTPPIQSKSPGYRAPELIETKKATQKSDVYSFGVLILEMLTGKLPVQSAGQDDVVDLPRWVQSVVREEWTAEVFDIELMRYANIEEEMVQMLQIAMSCVATVPDARPKMDGIIAMIDEMRPSDNNKYKSPSIDSP